MKRKIIGISIILLLLTIIPATSIATETPTPSEKIEGTIWLRGLVKDYEIGNNTVHAYAIRIHFITVNSTEHSLTFGAASYNVTFPNGYFMIPIGKLFYIIGISAD